MPAFGQTVTKTRSCLPCLYGYANHMFRYPQAPHIGNYCLTQQSYKTDYTVQIDNMPNAVTGIILKINVFGIDNNPKKRTYQYQINTSLNAVKNKKTVKNTITIRATKLYHWAAIALPTRYYFTPSKLFW